MAPRRKAKSCIVCKASIEVSAAENLYVHTDVDSVCPSVVMNEQGASLDETYVVEEGVIYERQVTSTVLFGHPEPSIAGDFFVSLAPPYSHDKAIDELFEEFNREKLGGASGDLGWSSFFAFQRCPYLWKRNYVDGERYKRSTTSPALVTGSLLHLFLALYYQCQIDPEYPINPKLARSYLADKNIDPEGLHVAWKVFDGYTGKYIDDYLIPRAVEYHVVDPKTKESCRYDMVAETTREIDGHPPGVYIIEHKTSNRFDDNSLEGWVNDGEVIGQIMLWDRLNLNEVFGELQGTIVNICGKQQVPKFHRTFVHPPRWQKKAHARDLQTWTAYRQLCLSMGSFPRSRANCINRWGRCSQWEHCSRVSEEDDQTPLLTEEEQS